MSKKLIALIVAVSFAITLTAKAATVEELQEQIATLMTQIQQLQAQLGTTSASTACFTKDLKYGMTDNEVKLLQEKLNVSPTSGYFGPLTKAAVIKFQKDNAITPAVGYVGQITRTKLNDLYCAPVTPPVTPTTTPTGLPAGCTSTTGFSPTTGVSCATGTTLPAGCTSTTGFSPTTGVSCATVVTPVTPGEASLTVTNAGVYMVSSLRGGDVGKTVLGIKIKVTNADATLNRLDVQLSDSANVTIMPWRAIKSMSLYDGSTLLKTVDTSSMSAWQEVVFAHYYTMRFEDIGLSIAKDTSKILTVTVDMLDTPMVTPGALNSTIKFENPKLNGNGGAINSIRATDASGLTQYAVYGTTNTVTLTQTSVLAVLQATSNTNSPKVGLLLGNAIDSVSDLEVFRLDLKSQNNASTIKTIDFNVSQTFGGTSTNDIAAVKLYDGSTLVQSSAVEDVTGGVWGSAANNNYTDDVVRFADLSIALAKDVTKTLIVKVDLKPIDGTIVKEGDVVKIGYRGLSAVDANYNAPLSPAAVAGYNQIAYIKAPSLAFLSQSITKTTNAAGKDAVTGTIKFTVTANNSDIYIHNAKTEIAADKQVATGTTNIDSNFSSSDAEFTAGDYIVRNGTTKTFTVSFSMDATVTEFNGAKLSAFKWSLDPAHTTVVDYAAGNFVGMLDTYKTDLVSIHQ